MKNKNKFFEDRASAFNDAGSLSSGSLSDEEIENPKVNRSKMTSLNATFDSEICNNLRKKADKALQVGKIPDALQKYENTLKFIAKLYGAQSGDFLIYFTQLIESLNARAMHLLKIEDTETSYQLLTWCEKITQPAKYGDFPMLRNLTLNNLGCLYRRMGKLQVALNCLHDALFYLERANALTDSATTYLNLCAVLSQMGNHQEALNHAKNALIHAQDQLLKYQESKMPLEKIKEKVTVLAISYHNMGVEEEYIQRYESALGWYEKSIRLLEEYDLQNLKLEEKFQSAYDAAKLKYASMLSRKPRAPSSDARLSSGSLRRASLSDRNLHKRAFPSSLNRSSIGSSTGRLNASKSQFVFQNNRIVDLSAQTQHVEHHHYEEDMTIRKSSTQPNFKRIFHTKAPSANFSSAATISSQKQIEKKDKVLVNNFMQSDNKSLSEKNKTQKIRKHHLEKSPQSYPLESESKYSDQEWEIKTLSKAGVLSWSDSEDKLESDAQESELEIKKNRIKFLEALNNTSSKKTMTGDNLNFALVNDDEKESDHSQIIREVASEEHSQRTKRSSKESEKKPERKGENNSSHRDKHSESQNAAVLDILVTNKTDTSVRSVSQKQNSSRKLKESSILSHRNENDTTREIKPPPRQFSMKEQEEAAIRIQAFYKGKLTRENYEILKLHDQKYRDRIILFRGHIPLRNVIPTSSGKEYESYAVMILFNMQDCHLQFYASSVTESKLLSTTYSLEKELDLDIKTVKKSQLRHFLEDKYERLLSKLYVDGHRLCIDSKHWEEQKECPTRKHSENEIPQSFGVMTSALNVLNSSPKTEDDAAAGDESARPQTVKPQLINLSQQIKAAVRIQAGIRRYLIRQNYLLRKSKKIRIVFQKEFKHEQAYITIKIVKVLVDNPARNLVTNDILVAAYNITEGAAFTSLKLPPELITYLDGKWESVLDAVDFYLDTKKIRLRPKYKAMFKPKKQETAEPPIDVNKVIMIQRNYRRRLARERYQLLLERKKQNRVIQMIKSWWKLLDHKEFKLAVYYSSNEGRFTVTANSRDYPFTINPVQISLFSLSLDRRDMFTRTIQNVAEKIRENTTLRVVMKEYKLEVNVVTVASQIQSMDLDDDIPESNQKSRELAKLRAKMRDQIYEKKIIPIYQPDTLSDQKEPTKMMGKGALALQEEELEKIKIIQREIRRYFGKLAFSTRLSIGKTTEYQTAESLHLLRSFQVKRQLLPKDTGGVVIPTPKNNIVEATPKSRPTDEKNHVVDATPKSRPSDTGKMPRNSVLDVKSSFAAHTSQFLYTGTKRFDQSRSAKIDVFLMPSAEPSKEVLLCDVTFEITGQLQSLKVPVSEFGSDFDSKRFVKNIKALLFDRLAYDKTTHKIVFAKVKTGKDEKPKPVSQDQIATFEKASITIQKYIRARNARKQFEILRAVSARNRKHLGREFHKIEDQYVMINYVLIQSECLITVEASLVEKHAVQSKVYIPIKDVVEDMKVVYKSLIHGNMQETKCLFDPAINKLKTMLQIEASSSDINIKLAAQDQNIHVTSNLEEAMKLAEAQKNEFSLLLMENSKVVNMKGSKLGSWKESDSPDGKKRWRHKGSKFSKDGESTRDHKKEGKGHRGRRWAKKESKQSDEQPMFQIEAEDVGDQSAPPIKPRPDVKEPEVKQVSGRRELDRAALLIQSRFKAHMVRELFQLRDLKKGTTGKRKLKKQIVLKRIRKIDNVYWEITAMRSVDEPEFIYFIAREIDARGKARVCEGSYHYEKATLLNTKGRKIEDFLIDCIKINNQEILFDTEVSGEHFVKLQEAPLKTEEDNLVASLSHSRDPKSETNLDKDVDKGIVLNQVSVPQVGNSMGLYSVVYNQPEVTDKKKSGNPNSQRDNKMTLDNSVQRPLSSARKDNITNLTQAEPEKNFVKVDIDANELRRCIPDINLNSPADLKKVSAQLATSIKVAPTGELIVDATKLDPAAVQLRQKHIAITEEQQELAKDDAPLVDPLKRKKDEKKTVLLKGSKSFAGVKYLIVIHSLERRATFTNSTVEALNRIVEEYDLHIQLTALEVDGGSKNPPIIWDLPFSEAAWISEQEEPSKIANFLMKRIQVFGDKFVVAVSRKLHFNTKNAVVVNEKILRMIQTKFRSRHFDLSYGKYKKAIAALGLKIIYKTGTEIRDSSFIVAFAEADHSIIQIHAWSTENFHEYSTEMSGEKINGLSGSAKITALKTIATHLKFKKNDKGAWKLSV